MNMKERIVHIAIGLGLGFVLMSIAGCLIKQEVEAEQKQYCDNVRDGVWPDFRKTFKAECGEK
ncbi:hypothetical protein [Xanthomonas phage XAJ2]|uniref:Lipoprotein n=1 Tax=Xanthomonas phage XAJ2 TaxID=1775249 RepID=A0A1I9L2J9_9CAUD|nr:hypothetical protein [Xanthomonas phage XAJ2]